MGYIVTCSLNYQNSYSRLIKSDPSCQLPNEQRVNICNTSADCSFIGLVAVFLGRNKGTNVYYHDIGPLLFRQQTEL